MTKKTQQILSENIAQPAIKTKYIIIGSEIT